ncbi:MAG: hypothetical protein ABSG87_08785 [Verrucomicrobiota bacterium]|jgi:hypothetical protein
MKKRLTYVSPLQLGIVLGVLYGIIALIFVPFLLLATLFGAKGGFIGGIFAIFLPIIYAIAGFVGGIISAFVYNLVAKWTGGVEFTTSDAS